MYTGKEMLENYPVELIMKEHKKDEAELILKKVSESHTIVWNFHSRGAGQIVCSIHCLTTGFAMAYYIIGYRFGKESFFK